MAVLLALIFGLFCVAVVIAAAVYGDRWIRWIVLFSVLIGLALAVWMLSLEPYP